MFNGKGEWEEAYLRKGSSRKDEYSPASVGTNDFSLERST